MCNIFIEFDGNDRDEVFKQSHINYSKKLPAEVNMKIVKLEHEKKEFEEKEKKQEEVIQKLQEEKELLRIKMIEKMQQVIPYLNFLMFNFLVSTHP